MTAGTTRFSMLAWLPVLAALVFAAGFAQAAVVVLLLGLGGYLVSPVAELVVAPLASRARHVRQARAPDASARRG